jgi:hypothetical protein
MGENSLHESIKDWYSMPGDLVEAWVDGYLIDIVRGSRLIEIQTSNFSSIKDKVRDLIHSHQIRIVHPVAEKKWIVRLNAEGERVARRKSPREGRVEDLFLELVYMPSLPKSPNLSIEVLLVHSEEILIDDGRGSWRRKYWSIHDRRLLKVVDQTTFEDPSDFLCLLPKGLPVEFTTSELAKSSRLRLNIARKMAYTLRHMGAIKSVGKKGRAILYSVAECVS